MTEDFKTFACKIAYKGTQFSGFAKQPGQLTVQGELEQALEMIFRRPVELTCAGRTDSGVHARGQVISFDVATEELRNRNESKLCSSLNALTHDDIMVKSFVEKNQGFSARFDAVSREYRYFIAMDKTAPLYMRDYCWHIAKELDLEQMRQGAQYLIGEHDFKSFCLAASAIDKPTHRYVSLIDIQQVSLLGDNLVCITVVGNAFLHSMVRTIVGTLVMVGKGYRDPEWVKDVLSACDRRAAGENAPACGLTFWKVDYR